MLLENASGLIPGKFSRVNDHSLSLSLHVQVQASSSGQADDEGPAWAPLRDNYMLSNSKLKDWDKMPVRNRSIIWYNFCKIVLARSTWFLVRRI